MKWYTSHSTPEQLEQLSFALTYSPPAKPINNNRPTNVPIFKIAGINAIAGSTSPL